MEHKQQRTKRKKKKKGRGSIKRKRNKYGSSEPNPQTLFALMLAALSNTKNPNSEEAPIILKHCLHQLHLSLLSTSPNPNPLSLPILSLLPLLLNSKCAEIACKSAEIVGAASLYSYEMNEQIALDGEIVLGLVSALSRSERSVSMAACNVVLDLSTTSIGRQRLLEFSAVENLIFCFIQVPKSSAALVALFIQEKGSETSLRIGFKDDDLHILLLHATVTLINSCTIEQLDKIPRNLSESLLFYFKKLWSDVHKQMLSGRIQKFSERTHFYVNNIRTNTLAESIFRLSIIGGQFTRPSECKEVRKSFFCSVETSFEHFILNHWEVSPFLIRRPSKTLTKDSHIFSSFLQLLGSEEAVPSFISSILQNLTSCLPIASDELNVLSFLKEVENHLGCPLIYQQDIRVLKTQHSKGERHFFQEHSGSCCSQAPHFLYIDDILKCKEGYNEGYTIALRGMEFRFESIAAIADGLASLFGQPSTGVNMYLTPPDSQGLARHCDDHCVLVCQLNGVKRWKVFPELSLQLPRLYEPVGIKVGTPRMDGTKEFLLSEGDVLYIPRGFPHEACTVIDDDLPNGTSGCSLHLTLAIEVEPPFEWEGFAHVALQLWDQNQNLSQHTLGDSLSWSLQVMSVDLLHVAIKLSGDLDPTFRKACLVGAISLSGTEGWLDRIQRMIFRQLINKINSESRFSDALSSVEAAVQKHEDPFQKIRWLQHVNEGETTERHNWNIPFTGTENYFHLFAQHKDMAEAAFIQVKSKFCSEVEFEDVENKYKVLLEKYRKVRKQYMNGMLSLHCN